MRCDALLIACVFAQAAMLRVATADTGRCPPEGWSETSLAELRSGSFAGPEAAALPALALALLPCLGDSRPTLRDGIAFEGLSTWLRAGRVDVATRRQLNEVLLPMLASDRGAAPLPTNGFEAPFAALVLSEVARTDRISAWMSDADLDLLVGAGAGFLTGVRDYRGFDGVQGWRHGVAHGADLALQLAMNPRLTVSQDERLLAAIATQIAPAGEHYYVYGEPERLARPVLAIAHRGTRTAAEWQTWFERITEPAPLTAWDQAFASQAGLAKRHNTQAFLSAIYIPANETDDADLKALLAPVRAGLERVP
jgi:hypothetical protein